jgi:hypothetical protein
MNDGDLVLDFNRFTADSLSKLEKYLHNSDSDKYIKKRSKPRLKSVILESKEVTVDQFNFAQKTVDNCLRALQSSTESHNSERDRLYRACSISLKALYKNSPKASTECEIEKLHASLVIRLLDLGMVGFQHCYLVPTMLIDLD